MNPELSVAMPGKNTEKFVKQAIDSLIAQTFTDWELVFVNDNSIDDTEKIVKSYKDERIRYFDLLNGTGIATGRDFAINKSLADIIVVADADDINYPSRLDVILRNFNNSDIDVFYSNADILYLETGKKITRPFQPFNAGVLKNVNFISNSASSFRKGKYFKVGGYNKKLRMAEDYDLWLKFFNNNCKFGFTKQVLCQINRYPSSATGTNKQELKGWMHQVKRDHNLPEIADIQFMKRRAKKDVFEYFTTPGGKKLWFEK